MKFSFSYSKIIGVRIDTNCISLTSNINIAVTNGRDSYKDKYLRVKVPKREMGEKVNVVGEYMIH